MTPPGQRQSFGGRRPGAAADAATQSSRYGASVVAKLALVAGSGAAFWAVRDKESPQVTAEVAAAGVLAAVGALLVGVQLGEAA